MSESDLIDIRTAKESGKDDSDPRINQGRIIDESCMCNFHSGSGLCRHPKLRKFADCIGYDTPFPYWCPLEKYIKPDPQPMELLEDDDGQN